MVAPATRPYRIIFFISTTPDKILVFPMSTAEILKYQCSINVLDYNDGVPVYRQITYNDYGSNSQGLMGAVWSLLEEADKEQHLIYSVHPGSTLLNLYRWSIMRSGTPIYAPNGGALIKRMQNKCVDLCDAFYAPSILSLDRRASFHISEIQQWLGYIYDMSLPPHVNIANSLDKLCLLL